jgi:ABC-type dipeptide/oligopeptide/nickel transport system ATPase subunit
MMILYDTQGLVFLPGMMTGQILGGQAPSVAAAYQVMIYFAISSSSCLTVLILTYLVIHSLMDTKNHRLQIMVQPNSNINTIITISPRLPSPSTVSASAVAKGDDSDIATTKTTIMPAMSSIINPHESSSHDNDKQLCGSNDAIVSSPITLATTTITGEERVTDIVTSTTSLYNNFSNTGSLPIHSILKANHLRIPRTSIAVSLDIIPATNGSGVRVGVMGRSGIGKSQLLRAIAQLEAVDGRDDDESRLLLHEVSSTSISANEWRSKVLWVSQDRPTLPGTPIDFLQEVLNYKSQSQQQKQKQLLSEEVITTEKTTISPHQQMSVSDRAIDIAREWGALPREVWHRDWNTLSGGEAQRVNLAMALALTPDILLLDEPTSACDAITTLQMEHTIRQMAIPCLIVSHDPLQIDRLCTSVLHLK